jgi:hypothetical protein
MAQPLIAVSNSATEGCANNIIKYVIILPDTMEEVGEC